MEENKRRFKADSKEMSDYKVSFQTKIVFAAKRAGSCFQSMAMSRDHLWVRDYLAGNGCQTPTDRLWVADTPKTDCGWHRQTVGWNRQTVSGTGRL